MTIGTLCFWQKSRFPERGAMFKSVAGAGGPAFVRNVAGFKR